MVASPRRLQQGFHAGHSASAGFPFRNGPPEPKNVSEGHDLEGWQLRVVTRSRSVAALVISAGISLAACAAGGTSPAARGTHTSGAGAVSQPTSSSPTGSSPTGASSAPSTQLNSQTLSQVDAQLGALAGALDQANTDLDNAQQDS